MKRKFPYLMISLLLHALALILLAIIIPSRTPPTEKVLDITLIRVAPQAPAETGIEPQQPKTRPPLAPGAPGPQKQPEAAASPAPQEEQPPPEEPLTALAPEQPPPLKTQAAPANMPGMFVLSYSVLSKSVKEPPAGEKEPEGADKVLADFFSEFKAKQKVEDGDVDPMFIKLKNDFEDGWSPEFDEVHVDSFKKTIVKWLKGYQKGAEKYGKTGSLEDKSPAKDHKDYEIVNENGQGAGLLEGYNEIQKSEAWTTTVEVVVDLDFDGKGGWKLTVHQPSGQPAFDEEAVDDLEHALKSKELKIPDYAVKTRWALVADFTILPPLPVAGISFDLVLKQFDTAYPLKKKISKRIKLLAVKKDM
jgi:hypothetical protein